MILFCLGAPVVNVASNAYSVNIGNSITLQCNVQANPFHTSVKWQRVDNNDNAVDIDMTNSRYNGSQVNSPSLVISQTITSDEGRYFCLATNAVGTGQSQQTYLTVVGSKSKNRLDKSIYLFTKKNQITVENLIKTKSCFIIRIIFKIQTLDTESNNVQNFI